MDRRIIKRVLREGLNLPYARIRNYMGGISDILISKDWDERYELAQQVRVRSAIIEALRIVFSDPDVMVRVGDNYVWTDGSNGFINFSDIDHYITDIGFRSFADDPGLFQDINKLRNYILYSYATSADSDLRRGEAYRDHVYNPDNKFEW